MSLIDEHYRCMKLCAYAYEIQDLNDNPPEYGNVLYVHSEVHIHFPAFFITEMSERKEIYIVVRGSHHPADIVSDFDGRPIDLFGSPSHSGFVNSGLNIMEATPDDIIQSAINNGYKFYFTGHSLGGAAAGVFCLHFRNKHPDVPVKCVTFGCPGLLRPKHAKECVNFMDSIIHVGDPVPHQCLYNNHPKLVPDALKKVAKYIKVALNGPTYYPLSFLDLKAHANNSPNHLLLIPPGRIFAVGYDNNSRIAVKRYEGTQYFDGMADWLNAGCHRTLFYLSTMELFSERAKKNSEVKNSSEITKISLPDDFIPSCPLINE